MRFNYYRRFLAFLFVAVFLRVEAKAQLNCKYTFANGKLIAVDFIKSPSPQFVTAYRGKTWAPSPIDIPTLLQRGTEFALKLLICVRLHPAVSGVTPIRSATGGIAAAGLAAQEVLAADWNGDGLLDTANVNFNDGVLIFLGKADGSTQNSGKVLTGRSPQTLITADFNKDQKADIATANIQAGNVSILLGNGDGTFRAGVNYTTAELTQSLVAADLNKDGNLDIAAANGSGTLSILTGKGDGTFNNANPVAAGGNPMSIVDGDFNGDQKVDLAVANYEVRSVSIFPGNGDGTFGGPQSAALAAAPEYIATADFNRDGKADVLVGMGRSDTLAVLLGNGSGGLQSATTYTGGRDMPYFVLQDVDGDGSLDILTGSPSTWLIFLGNPDGTFQATPNYTVVNNAAALAAGDFNGDGRADLAAAGSNGISVLMSQGGDSFSAPFAATFSGNATGAAAADLNGDGKVDLAIAETNNRVQVLPGNGNGTFGAPATYPTGSGVKGVTIADLNGDSIPDMVAPFSSSSSAGGVSVILASGGGFQSGTNVALGPAVKAVAADLNGDSKMDLAVLEAPPFPAVSKVSILLGNGNGTFQSPVAAGSPGMQASDLAVGDLNGDGKFDLVLAGSVSNTFNYRVFVMAGTGDGTFLPASLFSTDFGPQTLVLTDLNRDKRPDLVVGHCCGSVQSGFLLGNGDGTFQQETFFPGGSNPVALTAADFTGDGIADVAVLNSPSSGTSAPSRVTALANAFPDVFHVSAASFAYGPVAPDSIVSGFGADLSTSIVSDADNHPNTLDGVTVTVRDSKNVDHSAPLFFVSPGQVNYLVPADVEPGLIQITMARAGKPSKVSTTVVTKTSPGLFALNGGQLAAAYIQRLRGDGSQSFEPIYQLNASNQVVAAPIDRGPSTDQLYLVLFGTGIKAGSTVTATMGGVVSQVIFSGAQGAYIGLDQVNVAIPRTLTVNQVQVIVTVDGTPTNTVNFTLR